MSDIRLSIRAAMEKLDGPHRDILVMRYVAELSVNETAKLLGISRFSAYRLEQAALARMQKLLRGV